MKLEITSATQFGTAWATLNGKTKRVIFSDSWIRTVVLRDAAYHGYKSVRSAAYKMKWNRQDDNCNHFRRAMGIV